jgi:CheY-like chemotaxis protein
MATILIVDDERPLRELLVSLFQSGGHRVLEARDGRQALDLVAAEHPDAVVSDVMMPRMGGVELCRQLRQDPTTRALPVVLVSATDPAHAEGAGASAFVAKPFDLDDIEGLIDRLLRDGG